MSFDLPPIAKAAERLLLEIERAVSAFPRRHRYTAGNGLREQAMKVTEIVHRAWRERSRQAEWADTLRWEIDGLKIRLQLCSRLHAFTSPGLFWDLAKQAKALGKQAGGWHRQLSGNHPKGQSAQAEHARAQRAQKLSTRGASAVEASR